jgi:acid stress-induced BolA-like protein IbaG/YrbA
MSTVDMIRTRVQSALPGAAVEVAGDGGHFSIRVVSAQFEGKNTVARQRLVYGAIKDLMTGDSAPVHAVDRLDTVVP